MQLELCENRRGQQGKIGQLKVAVVVQQVEQRGEKWGKREGERVVALLEKKLGSECGKEIAGQYL